MALKMKDFSYPKFIFFRRAVMYVALIPIVLLLLRFIDAPLLWLAVFFIIFFILFMVFGISPILTKHTLTRRRLILRHGWHFKLEIPIKDIEEVETAEWGKVGLKGSTGTHTLYVTSSEHDLISIKLKSPMRTVHLLGRKVDMIVINIEGRESFLRELNERIQSLQPIPTIVEPYPGT